MCLTVLYIYLFIFKFPFNHAALALPVPVIISATSPTQTFTLKYGKSLTILRVDDIRDDIKDGICDAMCTINDIMGLALIDVCNVVVADDNPPYINILIKERVAAYFDGNWQCSISGYRNTDPEDQIIYHLTFTILVKKPDYSRLLELPSHTDRPFEKSAIRKHVKLSQLYKHTIVQLARQAEFNISYGVNHNFILEEGEQSVAVTITGMDDIFESDRCRLSCVINQEILSDSICETIVSQTTFVKARLKSFNVTQSHAGQWNCTHYNYKNTASTKTIPSFTVTVKRPIATTSIDPKIFIGAGVGVLVLLIIVGQTIGILYFKAKARKAEMIRNLTPKNSHRETTDERYVKKATGSSETDRESGIYEALESVRAMVPPPPPPIATLPVTLTPLHMSRSMSQSNLALRDDAGARTTPRPQPKNSPNPKKFNTVNRCTSLERIRNRPPQPLPITEEIYEDVSPATPELPKANRWSKVTERGQSTHSEMASFRPVYRELNATYLAKETVKALQDKTPLPAPKKKNLFGRSKPTPDPKPPLGPTRPEPNSPAIGRKPPIVPPGASSPGPSRGPMLPGQKLPGLSGRPPIVPNPGQRHPAGTMPVMGGMPVLPSMITGAHLKPVKHILKPPVGETKLTPGQTSKMAPAHSFTNLTSQPRPLPPNKIKPPVPVPLSIKPEPQPTPPSKPKLPIPVPTEPEPIDSESYPETYYGSSDEEFDCYDVLPDYRIYGNAPPKKIP